MNERIGKLAEQAGLLGPSSRVGNSHDATEKFAELIVERCMTLCDGNHEYKNHADTEFGKGVSMGIYLSKNMIKHHFGVKNGNV